MSSRSPALLVGITLALATSCKLDEPLVAADPSPVEADAAAAPSPSITPTSVADPSDAAVGSVPTDQAAVQDELMARWNAAAGTVRSAFDFHWRSFEQFPHPTFKGGSVGAYQGFAAVLLAFFQQGDDFDFLARNHLFTLSLVCVFPNGATGLETSFQSLAASFASDNGFGDIPVETRQALQAFLNRMP